MKILFITQYFPPETGAAPERAFGFAKNFSHYGHNVQVVTALPNHPKGRVFPKYRGKRVVHENFQGIPVLRTYVYANPKKKLHHRMLNFISFAFSCLSALKLKGEYDVLVLSSPPIFFIPVGFLMARLKRIPLVLDVRDLWPQAATSLGELQDSIGIRFIDVLMNLCYRYADEIVVVTQAILDAIAKTGIKHDKLHLITNGADTTLFCSDPTNKARDVYRPIGCEGKFIVLYAGVVGVIHGPKVIAEAARLLIRNRDIVFVVIGDGVRKPQLEHLKKEYSLNNLYLIGSLQLHDLLPYLQGADIGISTLQDKAFCEGTIPVKIFSYMACGLPVVFSGRGEGQHIIQESGAGVCVEPENAEALASTILSLKNSPEQLRSMKRKGIGVVHEQFSRRALSEKFLTVISEAIQKR